MSRFLVIGIVIGLMAYAVTRSPAASYTNHPELEKSGVREAADALRRILKTDTATSMSLDELMRVADTAARELGDDHFATRTLRNSIRDVRTNTSKKNAAEELLAGLKQVHESLTFRPLKEAEMPAGFPPFTPLHKIEVKTYPAYRMARVSMKPEKASGNGPFWSLFKHIKRNQIAMTAPVQVDYADQSNVEQEASMAFLYRTSKLGSIGVDPADNAVQVVELPKLTVVSIGVRGRMTPNSVSVAQKKLLEWLKQNAVEYEAIGPSRRMGYNSPFVPAAQQFFEVQLPIREAKRETSQPAGKPVSFKKES